MRSNLPYDAHTHTRSSDGRNSAEEMVRAAEACGLSCVALTDHLFPSTSQDQLVGWVREAERLDALSPIKVLPGVEGVILDGEGNVSVDARAAAAVKLVLVDFGQLTRGIATDPPASPQRFEERVCAALIGAAQNPAVDAIAHPFNLGRFDAVLTPAQFSRSNLRRVARAMADANVAFELMNQMHWWYPQMPVREFTHEYAFLLRVFANEGVKFIIGSDAHSCCGVGNLHYCAALMREADIELSQLVDLERMAAARPSDRDHPGRSAVAPLP
jgi:histidinol phosphatase-like PHP family hydrolase